MKLIVFLGNIGTRYARTRHNAGFLLADHIHQHWNAEMWKENPKFFGSLSRANHQGHSIILLRPHTFMNRSGKSLIAVKNFYKIAPQDILICYDDKDMAFGKIRFRQKGSSGGHNGVKDCIRVLGTDEIQRLKIGVDTEERNVFASTADFVLAKFTEEEMEALGDIFCQATLKISEMFVSS